MNLKQLNVMVENLKVGMKSHGGIETRDFSESRKAYPFFGYAEVVTGYVDPFVMFCNNDEVFSYVANWNDSFDYEKHTLRLWSSMCRQASRILDIGAHVGLFSLVAASANPKAQIDAFEAIDHIFSRLFVNVEANHFGNVSPNLVAISGQEGWVDIHVNSGPRILTTGASIVNRGKSVGTKRVKTTTVDNFCDGKPVDLIKLDIEEHEPEAIRGGLNTLILHKPTVFAEVLSQRALERIAAVTQPIGYRIDWISEVDGSLVPATSTRPSKSRNVLISHPERWSRNLRPAGTLPDNGGNHSPS